MDAATQAKLEEAKANVPRYLFRYWKPRSGNEETLKTEERISSYRFVGHRSRKTGSPEPELRDLSGDELFKIVETHVLVDAALDVFTADTRKDRGRATPFSSWTASPANCIWRSVQMHDQADGNESRFQMDEKDYMVSVVDTSKLPAQNEVFFVHNFRQLGPKFVEMVDRNANTQEYFIYGEISGDHLATVPMREWTAVCEKERYLGDWESSMEMDYFTEEALEKARQLGELYGATFVVPVAAAVMCQPHRRVWEWREQAENAVDVKLFDEAFQESQVPERLTRVSGEKINVNRKDNDQKRMMLLLDKLRVRRQVRKYAMGADVQETGLVRIGIANSQSSDNEAGGGSQTGSTQDMVPPEEDEGKKQKHSLARKHNVRDTSSDTEGAQVEPPLKAAKGTDGAEQ